ncbi:MAG: hypothetical protein RR393_01465 [Bacteroidales bacterium]
MKKYLFSLSVFTLLSFFYGQGQSDVTYLPLESNVTNLPAFSSNISRNPNIDSLINLHIEYNNTHPYMGYRILVFAQSGNHSKNAAMDARSNFLYNHSNMDAYIVYEEPYFKVKIGNFRTRIEAALFLKNIYMEYPQAYIVRDALDMARFLQIEEENLDDLLSPDF